MKIIQLVPGQRITKPGFYQCDAETYFSDPCIEPSFTQSLAKIVLDQSVKHAKQEHPRLTPVEADDETEKYSHDRAIGNAAHSLLIGRGKRLAVADFDDWRTKDAKAFRDEALADGSEPVLAADYEEAVAIVKAAREQFAQTEGWENLFSAEGHGEVVAAWQEGGLWFRTMIDWLPSPLSPVDFKTTGGSAAPQSVEAKLFEDGWDIQAAMHERALDVLDPENAGRRAFRFALIENYAPYALTPVDLSESFLALGRRRLDAAAQIWAKAMRDNNWQAYPLKPVIASCPAWAEAKWMEREIALRDSGAITDDWIIGKAEPPRKEAQPKLSNILAG